MLGFAFHLLLLLSMIKVRTTLGRVRRKREMKHSSKILCTLLLATALCFIYCASASAAIVNMDLLGGLSNFEWSPTPEGSDNEVAVGWGSELSPSTATGIYRLVMNGFPNQGNCQYMAVKNETDQYAGAYLRFFVDLSLAGCPLKPGDEVTFNIDNIKMEDFDGLPVRFRLYLDGVEGGSVIKYISPATTAFSDSITGVAASGTRYVRAFVQIQSYNLGQHQPGIFLDGAHFYVSRNGQPLKEEIPVKRERTVRTFKLFFSPNREDAYYIAKNYDMVNLSRDYYSWCERLRYFNPDIKIYWYQWGGGVCDRRAGPTQDTGLYDEPFGFASVLQHDSDSSKVPWLYSYDQNNPTDPFLQAMIAAFGSNPHDPEWKEVPYVFDFDYLDNYFARIYLPDWQETWRYDAINDITKYHYDGAFIDNIDPQSAQIIPPDGRQPWESQSFVHGVIPTLKAANISTMINLCAKHLDNVDVHGDVGSICFNPWWTPSGSYPSSAGYTSNTPDK